MSLTLCFADLHAGFFLFWGLCLSCSPCTFSPSSYPVFLTSQSCHKTELKEEAALADTPVPVQVRRTPPLPHDLEHPHCWDSISTCSVALQFLSALRYVVPASRMICQDSVCGQQGGTGLGTQSTGMIPCLPLVSPGPAVHPSTLL